MNTIKTIEEIIPQAQQNIMDKKLDNNIWTYPTFLGNMFLSEYYFEIEALGIKNQTKFDPNVLKKILLENQLSNGSWKQLINENVHDGDLDATIFNYWFLKCFGTDINSSQMVKSKEWILEKGGLEAAQAMTKFKLATFGIYNWNKIQYVPLFIFKHTYLYKYSYIKQYISQWVYPHLTALAYLRYFQSYININNPYNNLDELYVELPRITRKPIVKENKPPHNDVLNLINEMQKLRQPAGSHGAYTISTLLTMLCYKDFSIRYPEKEKELKLLEGLNLSIDFVEWNYFNKTVPYQGSLDDGRYWDTILVSLGLTESNYELNKVSPSVDQMLKDGYQTNGGIAYGIDFEYAPDLDDTSMLIQLFLKFGDKYKEQIKLSSNWLFNMQNKDGGWAAFDKDVTGYQSFIDKFLTRAIKYTKIDGSANVFDPSCPDITGHVLECYGPQGYNMENSKAIQRAVQYLKKTQNHEGAWKARWGINYIYASGAVLPGLAAIKYDLQESWIKKNITWLLTKQNSDGGFGEATLSYNDPQTWNGKGVSTVSQTAWALLALVEVFDIYESKELKIATKKAIDFVLNYFKKEKKWYDVSVVGTGHEGILYLQYPSYPESFPLIAISRYLKKIKKNPSLVV